MRPRCLAAIVAAVVVAAGLLLSPPARSQGVSADGSLVEAALHVLDQEYYKPIDATSLLNTAIGSLRTQTQLGMDVLTDISPQLSGTDAIYAFRTEFAKAVEAGRVPARQLAVAAITDMLASLHDSHVYYLDPKQYAEQLKLLIGEPRTGAIGIVPTVRRDEGSAIRVFVGDIVPGSPAAAAGLKKFDEVTQIDGGPVSSDTWDAMRHGSAGSTVTLTVRRAGQTLVIPVVRGLVTLTPVTEVPGPGVVYVRILLFGEGTADQVRRILMSQQTAGQIHAVILDLRGNPGGVIEEAARVAGMFVPTDTPLAGRTERGGQPKVLATLGEPLLPSATLALLVDGGTASASELVAEGLRSAHRATIVGELTQGAVGEARMVTLPSGGGLSVTVAGLTGPQGEQIEGVGITPDIAVPLTVTDLERGVDAQVDAALKLVGAAGKVLAGIAP